jgi:hypothetical protein
MFTEIGEVILAVSVGRAGQEKDDNDCSLKSILFKNNPRNTIVERFFWGRLD